MFPTCETWSRRRGRRHCRGRIAVWRGVGRVARRGRRPAVRNMVGVRVRRVRGLRWRVLRPGCCWRMSLPRAFRSVGSLAFGSSGEGRRRRRASWSALPFPLLVDGVLHILAEFWTDPGILPPVVGVDPVPPELLCHLENFGPGMKGVAGAPEGLHGFVPGLGVHGLPLSQPGELQYQSLEICDGLDEKSGLLLDGSILFIR